jgi:DHHA1 domain
VLENSVLILCAVALAARKCNFPLRLTVTAVAFYDIFNGDADGLCALQQLRLAQPREAELTTGVKRDIRLVERVRATAGDEVTVLDVSLAENREGLLALLDAGAHCTYFDHHFPGDIPRHPRLEAHIGYAPAVCTSLIVDEHLGGRFRAWAVVGAFGDNLASQAVQAALPLQLGEPALETLRALGESLNYNAYGDTPEDLRFHPAALYRRMRPYADPLEFAAHDPAFPILRQGLKEDLAQAGAVVPLIDDPSGYVALLPDSTWARRVHGPWANRLAAAHPDRGHAVLIWRTGSYRVSVRAPASHPFGADTLCRRFPSGGGRPDAAGINALPEEKLEEFLAAFRAAFLAG